MSFVMFGGSRALPAAFQPLVSSVVLSVLSSGAGVSVACAAGADQFALSAALAAGAGGALLRLSCLGSSSGRGFWSGSAPFALLRSAAAAGASVAWCAGGGSQVPFAARLLRRSLAALCGCSSAVFFVSSPSSRGSLRVAAAAARAEIPVFVFPCGFSGAPLPLSGLAGCWSPAVFFGRPCFVWQPAAIQTQF